MSRQEAPALGILQSDERGQITAFHEKPQQDAELDQLQLAEPAGANPEELFLASMGIYLFEPHLLVSLLLGSDEDDFGKHIIPDEYSRSAHSPTR